MAGGTTVARLNIVFAGDLREYRQGLGQAKSEGDAAAKSMGLSFKESLGSAFRGITQDLRSSKTPLADLRKEIAGVGSAMKTAFSSGIHKAFNAGLGVVKASMGAIKNFAGQIVKGFALGIGFTGFQQLGRVISDAFQAIPDLITKGREYIRVIDDVADSTGATAEETAKFVGVLKYLGVPTNGLINMIGQMSRNLDLMQPKLTAWGIATQDANGKTLDQIQILMNARKALQDYGVGTAKANLIAREFGRGGLKTLVDFMNLTDEQFNIIVRDLQEMGLIVTEEQRNMAEAAVREGARFENVWSGLGVQLFTAVGPQIMAFFSDLTNWIKAHVEDIREAIASVVSFITGLVAGLVGLGSGLDSFSMTVEGLNAVTSPYSAQIGQLYYEITVLEGKTKKVTATTADSRRGYEAQIKVVDKEIKALDALVKAEDRVYASRLQNIRSLIDEKLAMMDAEEAARELAKQQLNLNEQLNEAQIALAEAQKGEKGKIDADAVAKAMGDVVAAQRAIAELNKEQEVAAQRKTLTDAQDYIDDIVKLVEDAEDRKAAAKELGGKKTELEAALELAREKGSAEEIAILTAKLQAVQTGIEQVNARLRTDAQRAELDAKKEMLNEAKAAVQSAQTDETAAIIAAKRKQLAALAEQEAAWQKAQDAAKVRFAELEQETRDYASVWDLEFGDEDSTFQTALDKARAKGIEVANALKEAFGGFTETIGGVGKAMGEMFQPLVNFVKGNLGTIEIALVLFGAATGNLAAISAALGLSIANMNDPDSISPISDWLGITDKPEKPDLRPAKPSPNAQWVPAGPAGPAHWRIPSGDEERMDIGRASGGIVGSRGPQRAWLGEQGAEWVINAPALRALAALNRSPVTALAAVAGGGSGGSPAVIRLEIGGRPLLDYMDEHLEYRRRI